MKSKTSQFNFGFDAAIRFISTLAVSGFLLATGSAINADEFQLSLDQGSVITVDVSNKSIVWTNVLENGEMSKSSIPFSDIKQLVLSKAPASKQVAEIRRLLNQLGSNDYLSRELAEEKLSEPEVGGRFRSLIKVRAEDENFEVRYRIKRVLQRIEESSQEGSSEFDLLTLKDGTILEGDAGEFVLESNFRGNTSKFERSAIRLISIPSEAKLGEKVESKIEVKMFHDHEEQFYQPNQVLVDFQYAPNGSELMRAAKVTDVFIPLGIRFTTDRVGYVGISGYAFRFPPKPVTGNSICVYESVGNYNKRFKGITEIRFCMPNQAGVPAGVHEFGTFIARVNHSRDFLLEAYNEDGELLASVESTDEPCVFAGVKSNEPITKIKIVSNPYLFRIDRVIDEDYGLDSICFSPPVAVSNPMDMAAGTIRLRNGDLLRGDDISVEKDGLTIEIGESNQVGLSFDEIQTVRFNTELAGKMTPEEKAEEKDQQKEVVKQTPNYWMAILKDRSTIRVEPGASFTSTSFPNLTFKPEEILGLKSSKNATRLPAETDFEKADGLIVFPTCRIATNNLKFTDKGFSWNKDDLKIQQPIHTEEAEEDEGDPTPPFTEIAYAKSGPDSTPTVWLGQPRSRASDTGRMRLIDGQQLTLGGETGFSISGIKANAISVSVGGKTTAIPLEQIHSIEFPNKAAK